MDALGVSLIWGKEAGCGACVSAAQAMQGDLSVTGINVNFSPSKFLPTADRREQSRKQPTSRTPGQYDEKVQTNEVCISEDPGVMNFI
jgi:hypothetical protein